MQWSKLKAAVRSLICAELRRRVDFHVTGYHKRRSTRARSGTITLDGKTVLELSYDLFCQKGDGWFAFVNGEWSPVQHDEIHPPKQLGDAMRAYLDMPVELALKSANPFIRSLAIIDRRVGRRTLEGLRIRSEEHSLVEAFYRMRMKTLDSRGE